MSSIRRPNAPTPRSRQHTEGNENKFLEAPLSVLVPTHHHSHRSPLNSIQDPYLTPGSKDGKLAGSESVKENAVFQRSAQSTPVAARISCLPSSKSGGRVAGTHVGVNESERIAPGSSRAFRGSLLDIKPWTPVEPAHFDLEEDPSFWKNHNVQVLIRLRPISSMESGSPENALCLRQDSSKTLTWMGHPETRFTFDHVASETISQEKLFKVVGVPMVENCMSGYNSCMFAYGQTGSGKTHTMMGRISERDGILSEDRGMTPRIFEYLFTRIQEEEGNRRKENLKYNCKCSFLEIYNEQITDLLDPSSTNIQLREDLNKGVYVENLSEYEVNTVNDVIALLQQGSANRKMAATYMNSESSRSHSLFTCTIESQWEKDTRTHLRFSRLNLVDLAGSERQKSSGVEGERLREAANINRSLSTLGLVIMTLVDIANGKNRHVPYRDSRLTFLLQDSLGGNSKTIIIANVSPSICSASETLSTLKFAQRAKLIQNNAKVNEDASDDISSLQKQIQVLKDQVMFLNKRHSILSPLASASEFYEASQKYCSSLPVDLDSPLIENSETECPHPTVVGALRREKEAYDSKRRLEAENENLIRLVHQLQDDLTRGKKIIGLRDEKIRGLEQVAAGALSTENYLIEENIALSEEIQLLQEKVERNPQLLCLSMENIRLVEQLKVYREFYHEGERELLLEEISNFQNQLLRALEGTAPQSESTLSSNTLGDRHLGTGMKSNWEFLDTVDELGDCKKQLEACHKMNAELTRELTNLQNQLQIFKYEGCKPHSDALIQGEEVLVNRSSFVGNNCTMDNMSSHSSLPHHALHPKQENLQAQLLEKEELSRNLKCLSLSPTIRVELEHAHGVVDKEALDTSLYMQENHTKIQEDANVNETHHSIIGKNTGDLSMENQALKASLDQTTKENTRLKELLSIGENKISIVDNEWEKAVMDLADFLIEGGESLEDASKQIETIMDSFPKKLASVHEHVERAIFAFLGKDRLIANLQNKLESAQKVASELMLKTKSLKQAILAMTEVNLQENAEVKSELIHLRYLLNDNMVKFEEKKLKSEYNGAHKQLTSSFNNYKLSDSEWSDTREEEDTQEAVGISKRFVEAQDTIEEADHILSSLLNLNNHLMKEKDVYEQSSKELIEKVTAMELEVQYLKESKSLILEQNSLIKEKVQECYSGISCILSFLEASFKTLQENSSEVLSGAFNDTLSLRNDLHDFTNICKSWIETFEFLMIEREFAFLIISQCHFSAFADALVMSNCGSHNSDMKDETCIGLCGARAMQKCDKITGLPGQDLLEMLLLSYNQPGNLSFDDMQSNVCFGSDATDNRENRRWYTSDLNGSLMIPDNSGSSSTNEMLTCSNSHHLNCIVKENSLLVKELVGKDILMKWTSQLNPLQESSSKCTLMEIGTHQLISAMSKVQDELTTKTELADKLLKIKELEAELLDSRRALTNSRFEFDVTKEAISLLQIRNTELEDQLRDVSEKMLGHEAELEIKTNIISSLESKVLYLNSTWGDTFSDGQLENDLKRVSEERDQLVEEVVSLEDKLELISTVADENEAIAVEARQVSEFNRIYAEQKEEEVKLLECSVLELEETINALESKVVDMVNEVESNRMARSNLEEELRVLRQRLLLIESATGEHESSGKNGKIVNLNEASDYIKKLERENERKKDEIQKYKDYVSELVLHAEAQSALYQSKFKMLEDMVESVEKRSSSSSQTNHQNKVENGPTRTRGSGSPFRCISSLVQQMNSEKDKELSVARLQIEQLEDLAANRQKQVCALTARLAEVDTMTHDVIRDLLEVKLDMSNYAQLIEKDEIQRLLLEVHRQNRDSFAKEHEIMNLREQIKGFVDERNSWADETSRLREEMFAIRCTLEQVQQRGQLLKAQNEMLKVDKVNLSRKITEYDGIVRKLDGSQSIHDLIHCGKDATEVNCSRACEDGFTQRLAKADKLLFHAQYEGARTQKSKNRNV